MERPDFKIPVSTRRLERLHTRARFALQAAMEAERGNASGAVPMSEQVRGILHDLEELGAAHVTA